MPDGPSLAAAAAREAYERLLRALEGRRRISAPRLPKGTKERARAELLCRVALPHLPGSLGWSGKDAEREARKVTDDPLLNVKRSIFDDAWRHARRMLQGTKEPAEE
jgi:hypothetical protein